MKNELTFKQTFLGSLIAGACAAVVNNIWHALHIAMSGFTPPEMISPGRVVMSSVVPLVVAGLGFYIAQRWIPKGRLVYIISVVVLALLSCLGNFAPMLPDGSPMPTGFAMHTVPMHLIAGVFALLIPRFAARMKA